MIIKKKNKNIDFFFFKIRFLLLKALSSHKIMSLFQTCMTLFLLWNTKEYS